MQRVRIGLAGFGSQVQQHYWPYLERRKRETGDVEVIWASGYLPEDSGQVTNVLGAGVKAAPLDEWHVWLQNSENTSLQVDAVIVSLPNYQHADALRHVLAAGAHAIVDKPTAIRTRDVKELCTLAERRRLLFSTVSQRRYEDLYQCAASLMRAGAVGWPFLIEYIIAHDDFGAGKDPRANYWWQMSRSRSGGGVMMGSAYHGIDTVLWLLKQLDPKGRPLSVNARLIEGRIGPQGDKTEAVCHACVRLKPECLFAITASRLSPIGSVDETIKIFGPNGCIRIVRERTEGKDRLRAASLTYQEIGGKLEDVTNPEWSAKRWAPLDEFLNLIKDGRSSGSISPASDSLRTIRVIERAYLSAARGGSEVTI